MEADSCSEEHGWCVQVGVTVLHTGNNITLCVNYLEFK